MAPTVPMVNQGETGETKRPDGARATISLNDVIGRSILEGVAGLRNQRGLSMVPTVPMVNQGNGRDREQKERIACYGARPESEVGGRRSEIGSRITSRVYAF
jgi:hypothetical protein